MRLFLSVAAALVFFALPAFAFCNPKANICVNQPCNPAELGATTTDFDNKNIVACLINTAGTATVWKSTTPSPGFPANYPVTGTAELTYAGRTATCYYYTDAAADVYLRVVATGVDTGWHKTSNLTFLDFRPLTAVSLDEYAARFFSCVAQPAGVGFTADPYNTNMPLTTQKAW